MKPQDTKPKCSCNADKAAAEYAGVAINEAEDCSTEAELVKERTRTLNNNPRNTDGPQAK